MPAITLFPFIFRLSLTILFVFFISDSLPFVTFQRPAVRSPRRILYLWSSFPVALFQPGLKHKLLQIYRLIRYGFRVCLYLRNSSLQRFLFIFVGHKQGHEAPVKQLSAGVSGVDMYDRICFKRTIGITKKEQDNSCSYIQRGAKRQKKASVPIQLSGWLRTLALVRVRGLEPPRPCDH